MKPMGEDTLYIGTNYHPHDWPPERWAQDLDMMAQRGFNVVRLGHLCWDSFEPEEGVYTFSWMDRVMELCQERGIGVFLDIPTRPAPTWLHEKYPSIDIVDREGGAGKTPIPATWRMWEIPISGSTPTGWRL